jgi:hypothetical protein
MRQLLEELNEVFAHLHAQITGHPEVSICQTASIEYGFKFKFYWTKGPTDDVQTFQHIVDIDDIPMFFTKDVYCDLLVDIVNRAVEKNKTQ